MMYLMARVSRRIDDKRVLKLINKYLRTGVVIKKRLQAKPLGVQQGVHFHRLMSGIAAGFVYATGNSGVTPEPKCGTS